MPPPPMELILSEKAILEKTKVESLDEVRHLNLWGEGLTDVSIVKKLKHVEVIALAANKISSLKSFAHCSTLQELYLRKNNIVSLKEVTSLRSLERLHTLWLIENPCAKHPYYRDFVLYCCPALRQLDKVEVLQEERQAAAQRLSARVLDDILGRTTAVAGNGAAEAAPSKAKRTEAVAPAAEPASRPTSSAATPKRKPVPAKMSTPPGAGAKPAEAVSPRVALQTQRSMLTAIMALVPELSVDSLYILRRELDEHIDAHMKTKY